MEILLVGFIFFLPVVITLIGLLLIFRWVCNTTARAGYVRMTDTKKSMVQEENYVNVVDRFKISLECDVLHSFPGSKIRYLEPTTVSINVYQDRAIRCLLYFSRQPDQLQISARPLGSKYCGFIVLQDEQPDLTQNQQPMPEPFPSIVKNEEMEEKQEVQPTLKESKDEMEPDPSMLDSDLCEIFEVERPRYDWTSIGRSWVNTNAQLIEKMANEAIAGGENYIILTLDDLPAEPEAWTHICDALEDYGLHDVYQDNSYIRAEIYVNAKAK